MVDASSSIGEAANFELLMEFVKSIFHYFLTGHGVRFGLVKFGNGNAEVYHLCPLFLIIIYFLSNSNDLSGSVCLQFCTNVCAQ